MTTDPELKAMDTTLSALLPLDADARERVLNWLASKLALEAPGALSGSQTAEAENEVPDQLGTIKQFLKAKRPDNDVAQATALAYYLAHAGGKEGFTTADLSKARTDAALPSFNVSRGTSNARGSGYLTTTGKRGTLKVTSLGESLVEAMPDKEAVKKVTAQRRKTRRKSTGRKRVAVKKDAARS